MMSSLIKSTPSAQSDAPTQGFLANFWARFRRERLAYFSLILLSIISLVSLFAPVIANDKPLMVRYQNTIYLPMLHDYAETTFGGKFETTANYHDPVLIDNIQRDGMMIMPPIRYGEQTLVLDAPTPHPSAPSTNHWLGTDDVGRDVLARVLYGLRICLLMGFGLSLVGSVIGITFGALMGYFGGLADLLGQRIVEVWLGLPQLFVMMILASVFVPSVPVLFVLLLSFGWLSLVPLTRAHFLRTRRMAYVLAAQNLGVHPLVIIKRHILPSTLLLALSQFPFVMVANISALTTLDFLGLGLPMGSASLGELLLQGKNHLDAPHLMLTGFVVLSVVLSLLIVIGEGLRNALDVKQ